MSDKIQSLLKKLSEWDRDTAEAIELALAFGESGEPVLETMLERRLVDMVKPDDCCGICQDDGPLGLLDNDTFDDDYADDYDPCDDDEDEEPDELSDKLGVDVDDVTPLTLAAAIVQTAGTDELLQDHLIQECGKRGKSVAQLTLLVEGLH